MKIVVIGATGFIGGHFTNLLLQLGHQVLSISRSPRDLSKVCIDQRVEWLEKNLCSITSDDLRNCDALAYFAAAGVPPKIENAFDIYNFNVFVLDKIIRLASKAGNNRISIAGSVAEYGSSGQRYELIPVWAPLMPVSQYAASKALGFSRSISCSKELGLQLFYGRVASAYGRGQFENNLWPSIVKSAAMGLDFKLMHADRIRDFVAVEAVAFMFLDGILRQDIKSGTVKIENFGSGNPTKVVNWISKKWQSLNPSGNLVIETGPSSSNADCNLAPLVSQRIKLIASHVPV